MKQRELMRESLAALGRRELPRRKTTAQAINEIDMKSEQGPGIGTVSEKSRPGSTPGASPGHSHMDGRMLRDVRRMKNLTQAEVALAADLTRSLLSEIENNVARPTPAVIEAKTRVAKVLGMVMKNETPNADPERGIIPANCGGESCRETLNPGHSYTAEERQEMADWLDRWWNHAHGSIDGGLDDCYIESDPKLGTYHGPNSKCLKAYAAISSLLLAPQPVPLTERIKELMVYVALWQTTRDISKYPWTAGDRKAFGEVLRILESYNKTAPAPQPSVTREEIDAIVYGVLSRGRGDADCPIPSKAGAVEWVVEKLRSIGVRVVEEEKP